MREPQPNEGQKLFNEKTAEHGQKAEIARRMKKDPTKVTRWGTAEQKPDPVERAWLEDNLGIGWRLWDVPIGSKRRRAASRERAAS